MIFFSVIINVLVFALCAGAVISILVFVPLFTYTIPYILWVGHQNTKGRHKDKSQNGESIFRNAKFATKLYKAWILRKTPTFD